MKSKRSKVSPKYKTKYRVGNWSEYDKALVRRGDLTIWFSPEALESWIPPKTGKRGRQKQFSEVAIETSLILGVIFSLALRQTEGFVASLLRMMTPELKAPDHKTLSRRRQALKLKLKVPKKSEPLHLMVDSTGLSIFGQGQWAAAKHGQRGKRGWRKLHIAVNEQGFIMAQKVTDSNVEDSNVVPDLLDQIEQQIISFTADGAYDGLPLYEPLVDAGVEVIVPPPKNAVLSNKTSAGALARNQAVSQIIEIGRRKWRQETGWHQQARAENTMFRFKKIFGGDIRSRSRVSQEVEVRMKCNSLNTMTNLGMPVSIRVVV